VTPEQKLVLVVMILLVHLCKNGDVENAPLAPEVERKDYRLCVLAKEVREEAPGPNRPDLESTLDNKA